MTLKKIILLLTHHVNISPREFCFDYKQLVDQSQQY